MESVEWLCYHRLYFLLGVCSKCHGPRCLERQIEYSGEGQLTNCLVANRLHLQHLLLLLSSDMQDMLLDQEFPKSSAF